MYESKRGVKEPFSLTRIAVASSQGTRYPQRWSHYGGLELWELELCFIAQSMDGKIDIIQITYMLYSILVDLQNNWPE